MDLATGRSLPYHGTPGIERVLRYLSERYRWSEVTEKGKLIALTRGGQSITLEPGGQFEMSGAAVPRLADVKKELDEHVAELCAAEADLGIRVEWHGLNPYQTPDEVNWMPKGRYDIMRRYLPTRGDLALWMMGLTCTVQANLDTVDEVDFARKLRTASGIGALVTSLFANSPAAADHLTGYKSYRAHVWTRVDPDRCGLPRFVFERDAGYEDYVDWAVQVPMFFVVRDGAYIDISGRWTFGDLMAGRVSGVEATLDDWKLHISTLFPEVRARPYLEFRSSDVGPPEMILACPALWRGVLATTATTDAAWDLVKRWNYDQRLEALDGAAREALQYPRPDGRGTFHDLCRELVAIARDGLAEAGELVEALAPLEQIVRDGLTQADRQIQRDRAA